MTLAPIRRLVVPSTTASGQTLGRGVDFALVVAVFFGIGALLDRWLGTWPGIAIGLVVFAVIGQFVSMYYRYTAEMVALEAQRRERSTSHAGAGRDSGPAVPPAQEGAPA